MNLLGSLEFPCKTAFTKASCNPNSILSIASLQSTGSNKSSTIGANLSVDRSLNSSHLDDLSKEEVNALMDSLNKKIGQRSKMQSQSSE